MRRSDQVRLPGVTALLAALVVAAVAFAPAPSTSVADPASATSDATGPAPFAVGTGLASVHPDGEEVCLGGYAVLCGRTPQGTMDELMARGLAIADAAGDTVVLVTVNSYGWFAAYKASFGANGIHDVRQRIAAATGVPSGSVVVVSDHSHATPDTTGTAGGVSADYLAVLADGAVAAGIAAVETLQPAELSYGEAVGPTLDSSYGRPPVDDSDTDSVFRVLFAADAATGERIATFPVYSSHATVCSKCSDLLTGDWTSWSAEIATELFGGAGYGAVGTIGATDWNKSGSEDEKIGEARARLRTLLLAADRAAEPVTGDDVAVELAFLNEPIAQPLFLTALTPGVDVPGQGRLAIDRSELPPFHTGGVIGTFATAFRVGDTLWTTFPGEPFPQLGHLQRAAVADAQAHLVLGAANDFLGYMVADADSYRQTFEEGALFLPGCPEEELYDVADHDHDPACPGHWQLMVSPTIGAHAACTGLAGAERLGFDVTTPDDCTGLTASDGLGAPTETAREDR